MPRSGGSPDLDSPSARSLSGTSAPPFDRAIAARPIGPAHAGYAAAWRRPQSTRRGPNRRACAQTMYRTRKGRGTAPVRGRTARSVSTRAGRDGCALGEVGGTDSSYRAGGLIAVEEGFEGHYDL